MLLKQWFYRPSSTLDQRSLRTFLKSRLQPLCLSISVLFFAEFVSAEQVADLYDVDIPVLDESTAAREQAFQQGLAEVFVRVSGDSLIMTRVKSPSPGRYIKQFSYEPLKTTVTGQSVDQQAESPSYILEVQYNGSLIEKYLLDHGLPVWGQHRPELVVWLAVRDGANEYVLKSTDQSQLKTVAAAALVRRGIPALWPLYDDADRKVLSVADIRGGFKEPVSKASLRYSRGPVLAASLLWNGKQWQSSWSLLLTSENRHWSLMDKDYDSLLNRAIDQAADELGVVFAIHDAANEANFAGIQLSIAGVDSIDKYRRVENYLSGMSAVTLLRPLQVDSEQVIFELSLRSTKDNFLNLLHNGAELTRLEPKQAPTTVPQSIVLDVPDAQSTVPAVKADGAADMGTAATAEAALPSAVAAALPAVVEDQLPIYYYRLNN